MSGRRDQARSGSPRVAVIGSGRAGGTLAVLLAGRSWPVRSLWSRDRARARAVARRLRARGGRTTRCPASPVAAMKGAELILLAVPDAALAGMAERLARSISPPLPHVALHLSGASGLEVLAPLARRGVHTGSCHPLAVLPDGLPPHDLLRGTGFAIDGDRIARSTARRLARAVGGVPFIVGPRHRAVYHLAATLVANDTLALFDLALRQLRRTGLDEAVARRSLARLLRGTADALARSPVDLALTGPVVRGDTGTLKRHLQAAGGDTADLHRRLSRILLRIAARSGRLEARSARRLATHLGSATKRSRN